METVGNWVGEITTTVGTGAITLGGKANDSLIPFSTAVGDGTLIWYAIIDGSNREAGLGTYGSGALERTIVYTTLTNGVYADNDPSPLSLSGQARVYSTFNKNAFDDFTTNIDANTASIVAIEASITSLEALPGLVTLPAPPVSPSDNQRWIDCTTNREYSYYNDGDTSQWVEIGRAQFGTESIPPPAVTAYDLVQDAAITAAQADATSAKTKTDFISITQAVDLDQMETDVAANNAKVGNIDTDLSVGTVTANTLDINSSDGNNATIPSATPSTAAGLMSGADKSKSDFISVTQAVDLDSMESDITANNAKVSNVSTDLSIGTVSSTNVDVNSSDGDNATLPTATQSLAGVMPAADKVKVDSLVYAWLQYSTDVTQSTSGAGGNLTLDFADDANSSSGSLLTKVNDSDFRADAALDIEVSFNLDVDSSGNNAGVEAYVAVNGTRQDLTSVRANTRGNASESTTLTLPPFILTVADTDVVTFVLNGREGGNTYQIEDDNDGVSWAKVKVLRTL